MLPHTHFIFPFSIALFLARFNVISLEFALLCGLIGVLVDLDHLIEHILHAKKKRFSLKDTWNNSIKIHKFHQRSFIHFWKGVVILTIVFGIIAYFDWKIALIFIIGYYSHLFLDVIHDQTKHFMKWKIGELFIRESHLEFILDVLLIIVILSLILI